MIKHLNCNLFCALLVALATIACSEASVSAQANLGQRFKVDDSVDQLELIAGAARRLKFKYDIPELVVENPEIVQATPVSPNEILITGLKPGVSTLTVSDADKNLQMINVEVKVDTRKLEMAFRNYFPDSQIKVHPLQTGVILAGHVARADQVANIMATARDFFPTNVVNQLQVNGNQNIAIKVKIYEVSRTKLRQLGIDWSYIDPEFSIVSSVSQIIQAVNRNSGVTAGENTLSFGVVDDGGTQFDTFIQTLERHSIAKLLDQPILVAQNGRPAEFLSGGEIPILIPAGLGTSTVEFRAFGTKLDMVPIVHGNGELTLEVRAEVSEVADDLASADGTPGFRVRRVNTGVKMKAGHTLALAGDYREDHAATKRGIPGLMHSPVFGPIFRTVEDTENETELVFLITPRFISDVDPASAPQLGPGQMTTAPTSRQLMVDGYLEVPRCTDDCPIPPSYSRQSMNGNMSQGYGVNPGNNGQAMPAGYPGIGNGAVAPQTPSFQSQSPNFGQTQPTNANPVQPVSFNRDLEQKASAAKKKTLLQRIGISIPKREEGNSQSGGGFMWPGANGQ
ncbi:type II and III secretion system protein family protein [Mariniblastus fucicola]|uniref:Type II secretion system protein D n=1 Tax=Mariniblastus fucicola TaxID=980251 RepID=A0A5B9P8N4_9BACT|nr:pilus assembly protein N-terminal domain-containing protein [Mariniblastus fucicola]QEG20976.1 Type II secretion system protein D precursor [Mariniblastus fucicola]